MDKIKAIQQPFDFSSISVLFLCLKLKGFFFNFTMLQVILNEIYDIFLQLNQHVTHYHLQQFCTLNYYRNNLTQKLRKSKTRHSVIIFKFNCRIMRLILSKITCIREKMHNDLQFFCRFCISRAIFYTVFYSLALLLPLYVCRSTFVKLCQFCLLLTSLALDE